MGCERGPGEARRVLPSAAVTPWWGTVSWCGSGLLLSLLLRLLPPWRGTSWLLTLLVGLAGALAGGGVATALGFGGLVGFDLRGLATAVLAALLGLLLLALGRVNARGAAGRRGARPPAG